MAHPDQPGPGQPSPGRPDPAAAPLGDLLSDVPLLREIQRMMMASTGPVNWELARQIGIAMATWGTNDPPPTEEDGRGLADAVRVAELAVADLTGMPMPADLARVLAYGRAQWVEENARGLREVLDPVAAKVSSALSSNGMVAPNGAAETEAVTGIGGEGDEQARMLAGVFQQMSPLLLGAQVGTVLGYLAQRVFGQFDLAVARPTGDLYFVVPNIAAFERQWSLEPREFRAFVALHEVSHRFEFSRPWVREHFASLVRDLMEHAEIDLSSLEGRLEGLDPANPDTLSEAFESMGNLFGEATSPEQRLRVARVQAFMSVAEGYGDHVTETIGRSMLGTFAQIDEALLRFREGRHGDRALERLLGLETTVEQYQRGREFCSKVVRATDEATLSRIWGSADSLPSMPELEEPTLWLSRMA